MSSNPLTQKVNSWLGLCFVALFGLFMSTKIIDVLHGNDPLVDAVLAAQGQSADE